MSSESTRGVRSQTLERAIEALRVLADGRLRTSHELAEELGLARSNVYRVLRTFEEYGFVARAADGRYTLGLGVAALGDAAVGAGGALWEQVLDELANTTGATGIFCIPQKDDAVVLLSARPAARPASVAIRKGTRLPLQTGAPGLAILSRRAPAGTDADEVALARSTGYVHTKGTPFAGFESVAAPVLLPDGQHAAIAIVVTHLPGPVSTVLPALRHAVRRIEQPADVWTD